MRKKILRILNRFKKKCGAPPMMRGSTSSIDEIINDLNRAKWLGAGFTKKSDRHSALSSEEMAAVFYILIRGGESIRRIAELGTYTGNTTNFLAKISSESAIIEAYDMFEHNDETRKKLETDPLYEPDSFLKIFERTVHQNQKKIDLQKGNLFDTATNRTMPLDFLLVDIVKHTSIVNTVCKYFYSRLRSGSFLLHQDYYHWQSPWLVYQMEYLDKYFALVGDFGNNMAVYVKVQEMPENVRSFDFINDLSWSEKYSLMDQAIDRNPGMRAAYLTVSKLRLSLDDPEFDSLRLYNEIKERYTHKRVVRYADAAISRSETISETMW